MANISGNVHIQGITDADMVKIYSFKEKAGKSLAFQLNTQQQNVNSPQVGPARIELGWTTLEGAEAIVALMKELLPPTA